MARRRRFRGRRGRRSNPLIFILMLLLLLQAGRLFANRIKASISNSILFDIDGTPVTTTDIITAGLPFFYPRILSGYTKWAYIGALMTTSFYFAVGQWLGPYILPPPTGPNEGGVKP